MATDFALKRARFEMNCPEATATVLSKQTIEPPMNAMRFGAVERAEFTIGVAGCGKRENVGGCLRGRIRWLLRRRRAALIGASLVWP